MPTEPNAVDTASEASSLEGGRRTVEIDAGILSYVEHGNGRPVVLLHGVGTSSYLWRRVIGRLVPDRRCLAFDLPLHGKSPAASDGRYGLRIFAESLSGAFDALDLTDVDLVANDTGGAVAQILSTLRPERLSSMTLTNCEAHDNVPPKALRSTMLLARLGLLARFAPRAMNDLQRTRRAVFGTGYEDIEKISLETVRAFLEPLIGDRDRARQFQRLLLSLRPSDLLEVEPDLCRSPVPTLVVWGTDDRFFDTSWAHWLTQTFPRSVGPEFVPGGRLFFPDERGDLLVEHLVGFWDGRAPDLHEERREVPD